MVQQQQQQQWAEISTGCFFWVFFFQNVFSRHSHLPVPVREPEGRARDPGRATEPPALNQRDTRCVISHTNTHTQITSTRRGAGVRSLQRQFFFLFFARKGNRGPKNCCSCGSTWFKAPLPLNRPVGQLTDKSRLFNKLDTSLCVKVKEDKNKQQINYLSSKLWSPNLFNLKWR